MILDDEDILIQSATDSACYEMVDLGLSVKWANKNVGASSPEDAGLYFQWGDTTGYTADQVGVDKVFNWENYKFCNDRNNLTKYSSTDGLTILESSDDAATTYMGTQYRMPTIDEIQELIDETTQTFVDLDGREYSQEQAKNGSIESGKLKGVRFTGSNGNSIFIPAAGYSYASVLGGVGRDGKLWSSSLDDSIDGNARDLYFYYCGCVYGSDYRRYCGRPIRGVEFKL